MQYNLTVLSRHLPIVKKLLCKEIQSIQTQEIDGVKLSHIKALHVDEKHLAIIPYTLETQKSQGTIERSHLRIIGKNKFQAAKGLGKKALSWSEQAYLLEILKKPLLSDYAQ